MDGRPRRTLLDEDVGYDPEPSDTPRERLVAIRDQPQRVVGMFIRERIDDMQDRELGVRASGEIASAPQPGGHAVDICHRYQEFDWRRPTIAHIRPLLARASEISDAFGPR
jgi:hypothetical protein